MKIHDNQGRLIGELKTSITQNRTVVTTNTSYDSLTGRRTFQNIQTRDSKGNVRPENIFGKLLP